MNQGTRLSLFLACVTLTLAAPLWAQANLLRNPGFETGGGSIADWTKPAYWAGEFAPVAEGELVHGGKTAGRLRTQLIQGKSWARIHATPVPITPGLKYRYTLWARGKGQLKLGAIQYQRKYPEGTEYLYAWGDPVALNEQWQQLSLDLATLHDDVGTCAVVADLEGDRSEVFVDDAALEVQHPRTGKLTVTPGYQMVAVGVSVRIEVATEADQPLAGAQAVFLQRTPTGVVRQALPLDDQGRASCEFAPTVVSAAEPLGCVVVVPDLGLAATGQVDVVSPEMWNEFSQLAAQVKVAAPTHLLFLGDSLTDFYRGYNYVDQLNFWLQKTKGAGVTVKNAGVGGDYITRVWQRLQADPKVYRPEAYQDLLEPMPQRIFIFLGHNDSKESSGSNFTQSNVSPEDYDKTFRQVIAYLQQETKATITLLSASSSVYEITKANADKAVAAGRGASLFGRPETLEKFNALTQKIAADTGCGYLDVYTPTKTFPDKPSLFTGDGVHINLAGNHLIAREILRSLGQ